MLFKSKQESNMIFFLNCFKLREPNKQSYKEGILYEILSNGWRYRIWFRKLGGNQKATQSVSGWYTWKQGNSKKKKLLEK